MTGVTAGVDGGGGVACGAGSKTSRSVLGVTGGGVGGKCGGPRLAHRYLATDPGTPCFDRSARSVVSRVLMLEVRKHLFGTIGSPEH